MAGEKTAKNHVFPVRQEAENCLAQNEYFLCEQQSRQMTVPVRTELAKQISQRANGNSIRIHFFKFPCSWAMLNACMDE